MWVDGFAYRYYAGHKAADGRETYAAVLVSQNNEEITAELVVTEIGEVANKMIDAAAMAKGLDETGHIALYGIYFDTDKAVVKPESKPTLDQIAALLKAQPKLKVVIVGHTDSQGDYDYNIDLSRKRAAAVAAQLTARLRDRGSTAADRRRRLPGAGRLERHRGRARPQPAGGTGRALGADRLHQLDVEEAAGLALPERGVEAALAEQFVVAAVLDDPAVVEHDQPVHGRDGRQAMGDGDDGLALHQAVERLPGSPPRPPNRGADVASSRTRIGASLRRTRAMAMRWRWPPESLTPRSPTWAS